MRIPIIIDRVNHTHIYIYIYEQGTPVLEVDHGRRVTATLDESSGLGPSLCPSDHLL